MFAAKFRKVFSEGSKQGFLAFSKGSPLSWARITKFKNADPLAAEPSGVNEVTSEYLSRGALSRPKHFMDAVESPEGV